MIRPDKALTKWYNRLPLGIKNSINPILKPLFFKLKRVFIVFSQLRLPVYRYEGNNRWGDRTLTVFLRGKENGITPYFLKQLYSNTPKKKYLGKVFFPKIIKGKYFKNLEADLILVGIDEFFAKLLARQGYIVIPEWIMFKLNLAKPIPQGRKNKTLHENLKKIEKYGLSYEITKDFDRLKFFFNHMYMPYSIMKYGKLSIVGNLFHLSQIFENGLLLMVKKQDQWIAGFLIEVKDKIVCARYSGVKDGDFEYVKNGALAACYYFTISWARDQGYEWVDFGHCRPFFNDGAFRHKETWGMEICKSNRLMIETKSVSGIKVCNNMNGQFDFLENNPFICIDGGKLKSFIFSQQPSPLKTDYIQNSIKKFNIPGSKVLLFSSLSGFTQDAKDFASLQTSPKIELRRFMI